MGKRVKAYLPPWTRWFLVPILVLVWGVMTYATFFTAEGRAELGLVGWLLFTALLGLIGTMIWLMSSGKLPAYILELPDDEEKR